ncbi:calcitonin gene-related peptide 1-like isoform X1 [Globicephala melas]|uniref:calcitonin gene-related peptide 1-like isoform X1 n=1 Tax=Delphinus delphis TaxID=9728 RepID=UPI0028C451CE|nr:calcitonin gene-related peptide 1-like isoform X1 [Delphinus delphis]XP_060160415.1 calcitonin gene-related peptide 1-like isoform X1 [Globicephala melas]
MGFWKLPPFLVLSILVLNQAGMLQAAPFRWALENGFDPATLTNKEMRLLLAAMMNDYVQMKACELKQETGGLQEREGSRITAQKRSCNTATCVTHKMAGWLSRSENVVKNSFTPTNVGSKAFGWHRSDLQA